MNKKNKKILSFKNKIYILKFCLTQNQNQSHQAEGNQNLSQETIVEFGTNPKIKTDELGFIDETFLPVSFSLPPTSIEFQNMETNTSPEEKNFLCSDFAGSETYYFPLLQC